MTEVLPLISPNSPIFVVDDDSSLRDLVCRWLELDGFQTFPLNSGEECLAQLNNVLPSVMLLDLELPNLDGIATLHRVKNHHQSLPVIMMTSDTAVGSVVTAMQSGAFDYLSKPFDRKKLLAMVRNAFEKNQLALRLRELKRENFAKGYEKIIGQSLPMCGLFRQLDQLSVSDITVLILGASGTGKELVAQAIHTNSSRKDAPFVALNCAAIPEFLQESELFGSEKGSFTGATARKIGKVEQAEGGTLFLDEVGEMSLSLQAKLLRVLQEKSFQRLGGTSDIHVNFRLIAASHVNLPEAVKAGKFRDDLYFRLAVFELEVPTLAERKEDIPLITQKILEDYSRELKKPLTISADALEILQNYSFPGNVRELQNALHRSAVISPNGIITAKDMPKRILDEVCGGTESADFPLKAKSANSNSNLELVEKQTIEEAIKLAGGNLSEAIRRLGIGRATFYRKIKKYEIATGQ